MTNLIFPELTRSLELAVAVAAKEHPDVILGIAKRFHKYMTADPALHLRLDAEDAHRTTALDGIVRECLDGYEFRGDAGDYTPNGIERLLLEDFGESLLEMVRERLD